MLFTTYTFIRTYTIIRQVRVLTCVAYESTKYELKQIYISQHYQLCSRNRAKVKDETILQSRILFKVVQKMDYTKETN